MSNRVKPKRSTKRDYVVELGRLIEQTARELGEFRGRLLPGSKATVPGMREQLDALVAEATALRDRLDS